MRCNIQQIKCLTHCQECCGITYSTTTNQLASTNTQHLHATGRTPRICGIIDGTMVNVNAPEDVREEHSVLRRLL